MLNAQTSNAPQSQQSNPQNQLNAQNALQPAPVSLSQEREQEQLNSQLLAGQGSSSVRADTTQAVAQVLNSLSMNNQNSSSAHAQNYLNAPASSQTNPQSQNFNHKHRDQMTQNQGAAHAQSHNVHPSQSSQMMPASSASHSGQQNAYGGGIISAAQMSLPHGNKGTGVPHSGPRQNPSSYTGVVHTAHSAHSNVVSFDSGSTSFNNISHTQSNNQINPSSQMSRGQARIGGSGGAPLSTQVSSPPSN